jgi:hypothetical protein
VARQGDPRPAAALAAAVALAAIGVATLIPDMGPGADPTFGCILCGDRWLADAIVNVVLFLPLGIALSAMGLRVRRVMLVDCSSREWSRSRS